MVRFKGAAEARGSVLETLPRQKLSNTYLSSDVQKGPHNPYKYSLSSVSKL